MTFWVAKNRQKPPEENAFAQRARRLRRGQKPEPEAAPAPVSQPESTPGPSEVADAMPDLEALREAAQKAAELIHAEEQEPQSDPEPEKGRRGRKPSPAVQARNARILDIVQKAGTTGISKPDIAKALDGEKELQVYTSLRQLQGEGKVESKYLDGLGYRWIAV